MRKRYAQGVGFFLMLCLAAGARAESFSHTRGGEYFEAAVTDGRVIVKERFQGATTIYGDLSCPLGPGVKASTLASAPSRLCVSFAKDRCAYARYQNGVAIHPDELAHPRVPRMCIALASPEEARRFAALVNAGPRPPTTEPAEAAKGGADETPATGSSGGLAPNPDAVTAGARSAAGTAKRPSRQSARKAKKTPHSSRKSVSRAKVVNARKAKPPLPAPAMPEPPATPAHAHE